MTPPSRAGPWLLAGALSSRPSLRPPSDVRGSLAEETFQQKLE